jgi:hypothetical protein
MSLVNLSVKHGRTLEEARSQLEKVVHEVVARFGAMVQRLEWSDDRSRVKMFGTGFEVEIWVDAQEVHLIGDLPFLGKLLAGPFLSGVKRIVQDRFQKRLT